MGPMNTGLLSRRTVKGLSAHTSRRRLLRATTRIRGVSHGTADRAGLEYWPTPASEADIITPVLNGLRRHVFSRHLKEAPWGDFPPSNVESGDAIEAIRRIKRESTKDIVLWGSLSLGETFFAAGEVDAVRLVVMPVGQGAGRGVFPAGHDPALLKLVDVNSYDQGLVELSYTVRKQG